MLYMHVLKVILYMCGMVLAHSTMSSCIELYHAKYHAKTHPDSTHLTDSVGPIAARF